MASLEELTRIGHVASDLKKTFTNISQAQQVADQAGMGDIFRQLLSGASNNIGLGANEGNPVATLLRGLGLGNVPGAGAAGVANGMMQSAPPPMPGMPSGGVPQGEGPSLGGALSALRQYG